MKYRGQRSFPFEWRLGYEDHITYREWEPQDRHGPSEGVRLCYR